MRKFPPNCTFSDQFSMKYAKYCKNSKIFTLRALFHKFDSYLCRAAPRKRGRNKDPESWVGWRSKHFWPEYPALPETWSKCGGNCTKYKTTVADLGKILVGGHRGLLGLKTPLFGAVFQSYRIIDMQVYVYLVVFHGAELESKCFNTWNCIVCPFLVGITTLRRFRAKPGRWQCWTYNFFQKKVQKIFCSKIHFYQMLIMFPLFFF